MAYDDGYYFGQCKLICVAENVTDNGKTVYVTDGTNTWSDLIVSKKATFLLPPRTQYNVKLLSNTETAKYETNVELGYGECVELHLADGYNKVIKSEFDEAVNDLNTKIDDTKTELQTNFQDGVDRIYNECVAKGSTPASKSLSDVLAAIKNINIKVVSLGSVSGCEDNRTINVASKLPNDYKKLNTSNFYVGSGSNFHRNWGQSPIDVASKNSYVVGYDSETGILTVSTGGLISTNGSGGDRVASAYTVYVTCVYVSGR